jgi:hypothetical protein
VGNGQEGEVVGATATAGGEGRRGGHQCRRNRTDQQARHGTAQRSMKDTTRPAALRSIAAVLAWALFGVLHTHAAGQIVRRDLKVAAVRSSHRWRCAAQHRNAATVRSGLVWSGVWLGVWSGASRGCRATAWQLLSRLELYCSERCMSSCHARAIMRLAYWPCSRPCWLHPRTHPRAHPRVHAWQWHPRRPLFRSRVHFIARVR